MEIYIQGKNHIYYPLFAFLSLFLEDLILKTGTVLMLKCILTH